MSASMPGSPDAFVSQIGIPDTRQLYDDYCAHLDARGHIVHRLSLGLDELVDAETSEWVIAVSSVAIGALNRAVDRFRVAAGSIPHAHRSVLIPVEPGEEVVSLLHRNGISAISRTREGFAARRCPAALRVLARDERLWEMYQATVVEINFPTETVWIVPVGIREGVAGGEPIDLLPDRPMHVIAVCQPGEDPGTERESKALGLLSEQLQGRGFELYPAVGRDVEGAHRERCVAIVGMDDAEARELGSRFGQVAIFSWHGPAITMLATIDNRSVRRDVRVRGLARQ